MKNINYSILTLLVFFNLLSTNLFASIDLRRTPVVKAIEQASPAVVNISTEKIISVRDNPFYRYNQNHFLSMENFLKSFFEGNTRKESVPNSLGSGVIIDDQNHVLTNHHVIVSASKIKVTLPDKREFMATLLGSDPNSDLAVLQIETKKKLPKIELGTSSDLMIGETIIAIGNPFGLSNTVSTGIISALERTVKSGKTIFENFIQTDASINPGNSGGPLLNIEGKLIGINTAIYEDAQGIGFATPINKAVKILNSLLTYGEIPPIWLGAKISDLEHSQRKAKNGALVAMIEGNGPAHLAGIKAGDRILKIGGTKVSNSDDFSKALMKFTLNESIPVTVKRGSKSFSYNVEAKPFPAKYASKIAKEKLGITTVQNSRNNRKNLKASSSKGVIVSKVMPESPAAQIGIEPGDIIRQLDNKETENLRDFEKASLRIYYKDVTTMLIERGRYLYKVTVKLDL